jgi:hypothetical protein
MQELVEAISELKHQKDHLCSLASSDQEAYMSRAALGTTAADQQPPLSTACPDCTRIASQVPLNDKEEHPTDVRHSTGVQGPQLDREARGHCGAASIAALSLNENPPTLIASPIASPIANGVQGLGFLTQTHNIKAAEFANAKQVAEAQKISKAKKIAELKERIAHRVKAK